MGNAILKLCQNQVGAPEEGLSEDAMALLDHIGQILAEEYVQLLNAEKSNSNSRTEEEYESGNLRPVFKR